MLHIQYFKRKTHRTTEMFRWKASVNLNIICFKGTCLNCSANNILRHLERALLDSINILQDNFGFTEDIHSAIEFAMRTEQR